MASTKKRESFFNSIKNSIVKDDDTNAYIQKRRFGAG